jgi:NAD(P)-dependent dehydrogenase (short-subunit alcohol dehydrogenase family)
MAPAQSVADGAGMTAVVTGANSGIGLEVARGLAARGAHVVLAVRSSERGQAAAAAIRATCPDASLVVMELDLANLATVRRFAEAFRSRLDGLDLLVNNAGVGSVTLRHTVDGLFAYELQRRLSAAGSAVISVACHPGWAATNMGVADHRRPPDRLVRSLTTRFAPTAAQGARSVAFAAISSDVRGGDYVGPSGPFGMSGSPVRARSSDRSHDRELARKLWGVSEELTGVLNDVRPAGRAGPGIAARAKAPAARPALAPPAPPGPCDGPPASSSTPARGRSSASPPRSAGRSD